MISFLFKICVSFLINEFYRHFTSEYDRQIIDICIEKSLISPNNKEISDGKMIDEELTFSLSLSL